MKHNTRLPREDVNYSRRHPLREAMLLVAGVIAVGATFVVVVTLVVDLVVPYIPTSWELRVQPGFSTLIPRSESKDNRQEVLQDLLDRMSSHWEENPYPLRVGIMAEDKPNALAFPGGLVIVTSGLLDAVESENELAFVIGHELGHFHNRDHLRHLGRGVALALLLAVIQGSSGGESATGLLALAGDLTARSFSRDQEEAADAFGLELVYQEYGTVAGTWEFFDRLPQPSSGLGRNIATYVSTHPLSQERIEALQWLARDRGWPAEGDLRPLWQEKPESH